MKPGAFTQIYIQLVFAPYMRDRLFTETHRASLYPYFVGVLREKKHTPIVINGMSDHVHILLGLNPNQSVSDLVRDLKRSSSIFINQNKWFRGNFKWQEGYGAFSYGRSQLDQVCEYIRNQEKHHAKFDFRSEYLGLLKRFDIEFKEEYVFQFYD